MRESVLMLYGNYAEHPWKEDMFARPDKLQTMLAAEGFNFEVGVVTHGPTGRDELPDVQIARNPIYDQNTGELQRETKFEKGTIEDYASVIDHWVANFQDEVLQSDGTKQRTAYGIGLPASRLWNWKGIQDFGNHKDWMDRIFEQCGVGIDTHKVTDYAELGDGEIIYKPQGGSLAKGIEVFRDSKVLAAALQAGRIATNGLIQKYDNTIFNPIEGLIPATERDAELLDYVNNPALPKRPREIRNHVITTTDENGQLQTAVHQIVKVGKPDKQFMQYDFSIGLAPETVAPDSFLIKKCAQLAQAVCVAGGTEGQPVPQYYGVFDVIIDGSIHDEDAIHFMDGNTRGPGLPEVAAEARVSFIKALAHSGRQALANS